VGKAALDLLEGMMKTKRDRNLKQVGGKWYLDFTFKGRRIRRFGGYTKEQAQVALAKERIDRRDIALGLKRPEAEDVAFEEFADKFLEVYCKQNKRSWDRDDISLGHLKEFFKGQTLAGVGAEKIEAYKAKRRVEVSDTTVNRELACLKTMLNKAVEWGKLDKNPAARVKKFKEPPARERILTREEAGRLIDGASPELRPVLITAIGTGMRRGEILGLRWTDVDLIRGFITLDTSKSGRGRKIPLSGAVAAALGAVPHRGDYVFWNPETRTHIKDVKKGFRTALQAAEIKGLRFHDLRHTAASKMVEAGVDLVTVSKILGHASIQMTMRYAHPTPEALRLAVNRLGDFIEQDGKGICRGFLQSQTRA
jgi:integrase